MSEMIERVAEIISSIADDRADDEDIKRIARRVIEAMREPTQAMVDACDINIPTEGEICGVWSDMIDEALK